MDPLYILIGGASLGCAALAISLTITILAAQARTERALAQALRELGDGR